MISPDKLFANSCEFNSIVKRIKIKIIKYLTLITNYSIPVLKKKLASSGENIQILFLHRQTI